MVLILSFALVGCIGGDDKGELSISGEIETDTDMPVGGIRVVAESDIGETYTSITDEYGNFSFEIEGEREKEFKIVPVEILNQEGGNYNFEPAVRVETLSSNRSRNTNNTNFELKQ